MSEKAALGKATCSSTDAGKEFSCLECSKSYGSRQGLNYHYRNTECSGYECPECGKADITTENGLRRHIGREHDIHTTKHSELMDKGWFEQKYHAEGYSTTDIAELVGCSRPVVQTWKNRHGVGNNTEHKSRGCGEDNPAYNGGTTTITCDYCSGEAERKPANLKGKNVFCSRQCQSDWVSENRVGENHPLYKGDKIYYGPEWREIREKVRERDNRVCQYCRRHESTMDRNLDVHHIRPVREFDKPLQAHTMDNLISLCRSCHQKWEGIPLRIDNR